MKVQISLLDGRTFLTKNISVHEDSISWSDPETNELYSVPTCAVEDIILFKNNQKSMVFGAILGAISGVTIGYAASDDPEYCFVFCLSKEEKALALGIFGIPMGAVMGFWVDTTFLSSDIKYLINQKTEEGTKVPKTSSQKN